MLTFVLVNNTRKFPGRVSAVYARHYILLSEHQSFMGADDILLTFFFFSGLRREFINILGKVRSKRA